MQEAVIDNPSQSSTDRDLTVRIQRVSSIVLCVLTAVYGAVYLELFFEHFTGKSGFLSGAITLGSIARIIVLASIFCVLAFCLFRYKKILQGIFRWRYLIALALLVIAVVFGISGSSIGLLSEWLNGSAAAVDSGVIFGMNRPIRSDEWMVLTPFFLSQDATDYQFISDVIRGTDTVTGFIYSAPSWHLSTVFHPFLCGFLFFGPSAGLSFFWVGRFLVLFMVTFEFGRLITRDNSYLAAALAIFVSCSPFLQWWFAAVNIAEMFIFGQLLVVLLDRFLRCNTILAKFSLAFVMAWAAGCYIMVIYPAWQVPFFYIFAGMGIWVGLRYWRKKKRFEVNAARISADRDAYRASSKKDNDLGDTYTERDTKNQDASALDCQELSSRSDIKPHVTIPLRYSIISLLLAVIALIACLAFIFWDARELITATMNTVYPGERFELGGDIGSYIFNGSIVLSLPLDQIFYEDMNHCELATFIGFFPMGLLLGIVVAFARRDPLSIILLVIELFFVFFAVVGLPPFLASLTLLKNVQSIRIMGPITYIDILLIIRAITLRSLRLSYANHPLGRAYTRTILPQWAIGLIVIVGTAVALFAPMIMGILNPEIHEAGFVINTVGILLVGAVICFALLYPLSRRALLSFMIGIALTVGIAGMCINPIRVGLGEIENDQTLQQVRSILEEDDEGLWITERSYDAQALIAVGAPTINSVNVYPALERWSLLDQTGTYRDVYNRYAQIDVSFQNDEPTYFAIEHPDNILIGLNVDDLEILDVTYILSKENLADLATETTSFEIIEQTNAGTIYRVCYLQ